MTPLTVCTCGHTRINHHYRFGNGLNAGGHGQCLRHPCLCERFVCELHEWREAPSGEMVCRVCRTVADEYEDAA